MGISLETLALARKLIGKGMEQVRAEIAGKGDTLDYDGATLTLKSGEDTLSSVGISGGEGGGYPMADDTEVDTALDDVFGAE